MIKSGFKQTSILPIETLNNNSKAASIGCQIQTKYGYSYSEKELDEYSNSIVSSSSPPTEKIKKYIKLNIELLDIRSLKANFELNKNKNSIRDQICQLFISFNELKRSYDKEIAECDNRISEFILKNEKLLKQLLEDHKNEQRKFNQKWSDPKFINSFNKSSSNNIYINDQENSKKSISMGGQSQEPNTYTNKNPNGSEELIQNKISKHKEIEWKDLISSQKDQLNKFNENKYKYLDYLKMEKQKRLKSINCSLNQVKTKSKFIVSSKNFLLEIESKTADTTKQSTFNFDETSLENQSVSPNSNLLKSKSQFIKNKKSTSNDNKTTSKKDKNLQSKSQLTYLQTYSSTLNLEMSNVFRSNNKSCNKSTGKQFENSFPPINKYPIINQGLTLQGKNVFASKQPLIKKPQLLMPANKKLNVFDTAKGVVKKTAPSSLQIQKLGNLKEVDQITSEKNKVEENHQNKDDYQYHYNQKFKDNIFLYDYKKYKLTKKNPFIDNNKKKIVNIK